MADTPAFMFGPLASLSLKRLQELCASAKDWLRQQGMTSSADTSTKADCIALIESIREHYREERFAEAQAKAQREARQITAAEQARARRGSAQSPSPAHSFTGITAGECNAWLATLPPAPLAGEEQ